MLATKELRLPLDSMRQWPFVPKKSVDSLSHSSRARGVCLSANARVWIPQVESMLKHYKCPVLLIEFNPDKVSYMPRSMWIALFQTSAFDL